MKTMKILFVVLMCAASGIFGMEDKPAQTHTGNSGWFRGESDDTGKKPAQPKSSGNSGWFRVLGDNANTQPVGASSGKPKPPTTTKSCCR